MNPVRASLRFPQVTLVLTAMLFIGGVMEFLTMPRREDPKITIRTGLVIAALSRRHCGRGRKPGYAQDRRAPVSV